MVQKQLAKSYNKLGIQANHTLKIENKQTIKKPSLQTHEAKIKKPDLKVIKMKKSQSIKKSNLEGSFQSSSKTYNVPHKPENPSSFVTQTKTPSPKKPSSFKSFETSPNYMKSTSSSEARKENTIKGNNIKCINSKLHKFAKTLIKSSNLKKVRTLTKAPSFKHKRSTSSNKVVLCHTNKFDVQRVTCSSTLKDSKFPNYLELKPGATEAEGNSEFKVCPYTYCSLNGLHHINAPPLKRFLASKRRIMKTLKVSKPQIHSSRKAQKKQDQIQDFFVEVFASGTEVIDTQVSQSLSDGPFSEIDFEVNLDQNETNFSSASIGCEGYATIAQKQLLFENNEEINSNLSVSLDEFYSENSDMEWEEGNSPDVYDLCEIFVQTDYSKGNEESLGYASNKNANGNLGFLADEYPQQFHDEIVECLHCSDADSSSDSESAQIGQKLIEQIVAATDDILSEPSDRTKDTYLSNQEVQEVQDEEFDTYESRVATKGKESDTENYTVVEINKDDSTAFDMEQTEPIISIPTWSEPGRENIRQNITNSEEDNDLGKAERYSDKNDALEMCNKLKRSMRYRKEHEGIEEEREFNPRGPNFLPIEVEQEAEKVDLRHQEMDKRRNADEWMLDYALQKTVNQLAPARKRVALLIEAFESVLPIPICENHMSRNSSASALHARPIRACS